MRRNRILFVAMLFLVFGFGLGFFSCSSLQQSPIQQSSTLEDKTASKVVNSNVEGVGLYKVSKVVDGDTLKIIVNGKEELVRFLGINTPEVENSYRHAECFGKEASTETKKLLTNQEVYLLPDPEAPNRGKYGRLLRYVFLPNGEFINADLIKDGYAFAYIYQPIKFKKYFMALENQAQKSGQGLWSDKCHYKK
jgi:micrococcal nuclease